MLKKTIIAAGVLAIMAGSVLAQHHDGGAPPPEPPQMILIPPPGTEPPTDPGEPPADPEAAKDWLTGIFYPMMDTDGNGSVSQTELRAWVAWVHIPMPPEGADMGEGEGGEKWPEGMCGEAAGNEVTCSVSISPGPNNEAITLPPGREAGCFRLMVTGADIETTPNEFQIVDEATSGVVWHSMTDGRAAFEALVLTEGIYQIQLISSDVPTAVFTITFVDYPVGP